MPTIWDVAKEAGVSISSVSNALNGKNKVSESTRARIDAAVRKLGYTVDPAASSLKSRSTRIIGLIVPSIDSAFFPAVISGLQSVLERNGYIINFYSTGFSAGVEEKYVKTLLDAKVDGMIIDSVSLNGSFISSLSELSIGKKRVPVVALERDLTESGLTSVYADNYKGGRMAAAHLLSRGSKCPAHISGKPTAPWSAERMRGFRDVLAEAGLELPGSRVACGGFTLNGGREAVGSLRDFDSVFAANDLSAVGAMQALLERGVRVPEDVKVIGFDNTYVTHLTTPSVSTIDLSKERLGIDAGEAILRALSGGKVENIELPLTLMSRRSTEILTNRR